MIDKLKFRLMHLADYLLLITKTHKILSNYDGTELQLDSPKAKVLQASTLLQESMKVERATFRTQELANLDLNRDDSWKCFYYFIISQSFNLDLTIRSHANKLLTIIRTPEMRIYKMGYQDQSACMINFFNRVDSNAELTDAIKKTAARILYNQVKSTQQAFQAKDAEKDKEESEKTNAEGNKAAKEVRAALEGLNRFLMVMKDINGNEEYDKIAALINETVQDINAKVSARATRRENAKEEEEVAEN